MEKMILKIEMKFGETFLFARNEASFFAQPDSLEAIGLLLADELFISTLDNSKLVVYAIILKSMQSGIKVRKDLKCVRSPRPFPNRRFNVFLQYRSAYFPRYCDAVSV